MIGCQYLFIVCALLTVLHVVSYNLTCPENLHRTYRMQSLCNTTLLPSYSCLLDRHSNEFNESCEEVPDFVRPGQRYVINGFRTNTYCSRSTYQPFKFWSQKYSKCIYIKSLCNGIGQLLYESNSTIKDNKCGCDHINGYAFLVKPKDRCYCIPTEQDCTCFRKKCPPNSSLSTDYRCMSNLTSSEISMCKKNIHLKNMENTDIIHNLSSEIKGSKQTHRHKNYVVTIIVFTATVMMCLAVCLIEKFPIIEKLLKGSRKKEDMSSVSSTGTLSKFKTDADTITMVPSASTITISFDQTKLKNFNENHNTQAHYEIKYRQQGQVQFTLKGVSNGVSEKTLKELKSNTMYDVNIYICDKDGRNHRILNKTCETKKHCAYFLMVRDCLKDDSTEPNLYQLKPVKVIYGKMNENFGFENASPRVRYCDMIANYQLGTDTSEEKTLIFVGETGTGKSTLINAMMNYAAGVSYNDDHRFKLIYKTAEEEANIQMEHESQTSSVTVYRLPKIKCSRVSFKLNIIDTPGFNDTRQDFDSSITTQIKEVFEGEIDHLDAILIVLSSKTTTLSDGQRHVFTKIVNMFGKDITRNVFVAITYFDGVSTENSEQVLKNADVPYNCIFKFNNAHVLSKTNESDQSNDKNEEHIWSNRSKSFDELFIKLNKTPKTTVKSSVEVMEIQLERDNHLSKLKENIYELAQALDIYKSTDYKEILEKIEKECPENKQRAQYRDLVQKTKRSLHPIKSTNCKDCKDTCLKMGLFSSSAIFSHGKCKTCKCGESSHEREFHTYSKKYEIQVVSGEDAVNNQTIIVKEIESLKSTLLGIENLTIKLNEKALAKNSTDLSGIVRYYIKEENSEKKEGFETRVQILQQILQHVKMNNSIQQFTITI